MNERATGDRPLWTPSEDRIAAARMTAFMKALRDRHGVECADYFDLWRWSVDNLEDFWTLLWDFADVIAETRGERVLIDGDRMPGARFFPDARLNFAENLLRRDDEEDAVLFRNEIGEERRLSWAELRAEVARLANAFKADGVQPGDRIAAYMPNIPETAIAALAAASIGAVFSSCAPDFGVQGVLDRLGQVEPAILLAADGYHYNGKTHRAFDRLPEILAGLPSVRRTVLVPYIGETEVPRGLTGAVTLADYTAGAPADRIPFERLPFDHPLYILFSSGTTGAPKCIVHRAGGILTVHLKELLLNNDAGPGDRVFYYTSTNWMVWNLHLSFLACGSAVMLYDGSPFYPSYDVLFDYISERGATQVAASAKYIDALKQQDWAPSADHDLSALELFATSGSPLVPESFDYVYERIKRDLQLASVSGGTDLLGSLVGANPIGPVWRGEIQAPALAMDVAIFDDDGTPLPPGEAGELVCRKPFPSMPLGFLNDPDGRRYFEAYYDHFPNVWRHGDRTAFTEHGGAIIYGRSDATLNPGGIRIGTAEIYRQVEQLDEVAEAIAIGQEWKGDTRIVLFVRLAGDGALDDALRERIKRRIRENTTPRHVPAKILEVPDIPRTKTGKLVELAVRDVVHGRPVKNVEALANPEALSYFENRAELAE